MLLTDVSLFDLAFCFALCNFVAISSAPMRAKNAAAKNACLALPGEWHACREGAHACRIATSATLTQHRVCYPCLRKTTVHSSRACAEQKDRAPSYFEWVLLETQLDYAERAFCGAWPMAVPVLPSVACSCARADAASREQVWCSHVHAVPG